MNIEVSINDKRYKGARIEKFDELKELLLLLSEFKTVEHMTVNIIISSGASCTNSIN